MYPPQSHTGPVVMVCGDVDDDMFARGPGRGTAEGWFLRISNPPELTILAGELLARSPTMAGQLAVMFRCLPDRHEDESLMRASLKAVRLQIKQLRGLTGYTVPVVLNAEFSGPETPWIVVRGNAALVCCDGGPPITLSEWQRAALTATVQPFLAEATTMLHKLILDELEKAERLYPGVIAG
ncbi:hypothetical protein [Enterobacter sp. 638]|uniref:Uncharacterized protein n=1 Tax=Enterobacter sp. (strain 638) TaxID=399742 RepID=A0A9J9GHS2_ENT38|nr:hypothetical protein [Enterobacter sp. 638]ABP61577.1 hypothetical protein Ent638_2913 [Enterobacter sp. 638]